MGTATSRNGAAAVQRGGGATYHLIYGEAGEMTQLLLCTPGLLIM